jgi:hypothetical protein
LVATTIPGAAIHDAHRGQHDRGAGAVRGGRGGQRHDADTRLERRQVVEVLEVPRDHERYRVVVSRDLDHAIVVAAHLELDATAVECEIVRALDADAGLREVVRDGAVDLRRLVGRRSVILRRGLWRRASR